MNSDTRFPGWGSAQLAILLSFTSNSGLSIDDALKGSGLTEVALIQGDPSKQQELTVIRNMMEMFSFHPFELGFQVGRTCSGNTFGLLGQALAACRTPKQILSIVSEFLKGSHHFLKIQNQIRSGHIRTVFETPSDLPADIGYFLLGRDMGASIAFQESILLNQPSFTTEVGFKGPEKPGMANVAKHYGCIVKFNQPANYFHNSLRVLKLVLPIGNQYLSDLLVKRVRNFLMNKKSASSKFQKVQMGMMAVLEKNGYADMSKDEMAKHLNISSRTLSRYLEKEGSSWRQFYTDTRMEKAKELMVMTEDNLEKIASKVGFSTASAFSAAFSRNLGMSPQAYRRSKHNLPVLDY